MLYKSLAALLVAALAGALCGQSYTVSSGALASYPVLTGATDLNLTDDDLSAPISPSGFDFVYFGAHYSSFQVGTNGYIVLGGSGSITAPSPDYGTSPGLVIAPCWVNLYSANLPSNPGGIVRWRMDLGVLQVEWNNMAQNTGPAAHVPPPSLDMVVNLDTATGEIEFDYGFSGATSVEVKSQVPNTAAISSASGANQEIIPAHDGAAINQDGSISSWPTYRRVTFSPAGSSSGAPTIDVTSNGTPLGNGDTLNAAYNATLASLGLSISVDDPDGDDVSLAGSVSNKGTTGLLDSEFSSGFAPVPYALTPTSGTFNSAGATHTVTLTAGDGLGGSTQLSFDIVVGGAPQNASPQISVTLNGSPVGDGSIVPVGYNASLASLNLVIGVDDPESNPANLVAVVANLSSEGILSAEFSHAGAAVPYSVTPTSGVFNRAGATLPVTLTSSDGIAAPAHFTFTLQVAQSPVPTSGIGGGSGGGGCVAGSGVSLLPLFLLGAFVLLWTRRRTC